jgi:hypothetical protein
MTYDHDTPRTDAAKVDKGGMTFVWVEFARKLERELNASQEAYLKSVERDDYLTQELEELQQQKRNCIEILDDDAKEMVELKAEVERLSKLTEDCLNVIRVYCPTYYNDAMERFNKTEKAKK